MHLFGQHALELLIDYPALAKIYSIITERARKGVIVNLFGKSITATAAAVTLAVGMLATASPAGAATEPSTPEPTAWGMVAIDVDPSSSVTTMAVKDVGGGTWNYGSTITDTGKKRCYSYYFHGSKQHSATAKIGSNSLKAAAAPGKSAMATAVAGVAYTCYAYWAVYD
ncbi:lactococcin 972 family bacteriocin [Streptomyces sp. RM72]|uniref:lactococcin 972 family bacteriocin n=1 Tax=Streptomyces sp. RM72 TaxID=1115510 RepID=UPI001B37D848|nr:lactococcin 972 family bacteriocin [Streptomyces sp. RM72]MBQ0887846.1 lactococcin 972 family bacteriocin [Streptomyces sp. RM72]